MSRIGKKPINIPEEVEIKIDKDNIIPISNSNENRAKYGLYRSLINNMVIGVSSGFSKTLKIVGVGFRASKKGNDLEILAGYSNPVIVNPLQGISFDVPDNTTIVVRGIDKQVVGEMAAKIRSIREPEPYKGKGIKYSDEVIRRKVGKAAITTGI